MQTERAPIPLYLFAKAPRAGEVKTRMQPQLSATAAARLAQFMLEQTVENACAHWPGAVALCVAPRLDAPAFARLAARHRIAVTLQTGGDLGCRMQAALAAGIARAGAAAVMGCDVPHCPGAALAEAHALLVRGENPVGATVDGGFYFLGLQRAEAALFAGVAWSGAAVLETVRARAAAAGLQLTDLPRLRDIDHYADLQWLAGVEPAYRRFVAATARSETTAAAPPEQEAGETTAATPPEPGAGDTVAAESETAPTAPAAASP